MAEPIRAIDASVLLRYLLQDIPDQAARARTLIDSDRPLGLTAVALAEVAWTLAGPRYRRPRVEVAAVLLELLARDNVATLGFAKVEAQLALRACAMAVGGANFGDALIAAVARSAGVGEIYSFDQRFTRAGLIPIVPGD